jgi:transposase
MISLTSQVSRIFVAQYRVDHRKGHDGLLAEAYKLNLDPYKGDLIIFVGRTNRRIKVLYADSTGLWVSCKRFTMSSMKTRLRFLNDPSCKVISSGEFGMLLEGSSYVLTKQIGTYP